MSVAPTLSTEPVYEKVKQQVDAPTIDRANINEVYYIDQISEYILHHSYQTPCLQFPDYLVRDSSQVASQLERKIGRKVYVLADTSYSPCCIDEVAAQHVKGDVVFHFGNACLNPTRSVPTVYVSRKEFSIDLKAVQLSLPKNPKIILYPETKYTELAHELVDGTSDKSIVVATPTSTSASFIPKLNEHFDNGLKVHEIPNRVLSERIDDLSEYDFVYLTDDPSESLTLHWSTIFQQITVLNGHGERLSINAALRKRYRYVQNIKAAGTIGILVNTLSLRDTANLLERTKKAITSAEKKYYMFVVGKPNVAKLGNFEAIDVWVILGCPQGGVIVDNEEYMKPIVTPYELELAFNDDWTGKWILDFNQVLKPEEDDNEKTSEVKTEHVENEPLFDLVTGKFVFNNAPLRQISHLDLEEQSVQTTSNSLAIRNTVSTAAQKLQQRTWQGLGSDHGEITEEYAELKKGRSGIARNYQEQS